MMRLLQLYQTAEENGVEVDCFCLDSREALSVMDHDCSCFIAIDPFQLTSRQDETLKLAHELGHCLTGSFYNRWASCDIRQKHENRADRWAIERLVPKEQYDAALRNGCTELWNLAEHFDVTEDFMRKAVCWYTYGNLAVEQYLG